MTGCSNSCIESGAGFRLVTRECLAPHDCAEGLHHSVQICHERLASSFHCNQRILYEVSAPSEVLETPMYVYVQCAYIIR